MNVSTLVSQAAELNEDGVYELADGNYGEAMRSFENALKTMMQVCQLDANAKNKGGSSLPRTASSNSMRRSSSHKQLVPDPTPMLPPPSRSSVEVPYLRDDRFYLYSCTVTFSPPSSNDASPPCTQEIAFYCATILFNLALAHHQQGQKHPAQREACLRQALCLYQEAARTLQCLPQLDDILLMTLAILNNSGQILYALREAVDRDLCFRQLFLQSTTALHTANNFSVFEQSQINEFLRNAMVGTTLAVGGEAAAACA